MYLALEVEKEDCGSHCGWEVVWRLWRNSMAGGATITGALLMMKKEASLICREKNLISAGKQNAQRTEAGLE